MSAVLVLVRERSAPAPTQSTAATESSPPKGGRDRGYKGNSGGGHSTYQPSVIILYAAATLIYNITLAHCRWLAAILFIF
jgi:hypothetical protein